LKTRIANLALAGVYFVLGVALIRSCPAENSPAPHSSTSKTPAPVRQDADALLARVSATLGAAKSIQADFEETDSYPTPYKDLAQRGTVSLARPGRLRLDIERFRRANAADPWTPSGNDAVSASDGATYTYAFLHPHSAQVRTQATSADTLRNALKLTPALADFFVDGTRTGFDHPSGAAHLLPEADWEGVKYDVIEFLVTTSQGAADARAYIGADNLIHRLVYSAETPKGAIVKEFTLRNLRLNAGIPATAFAYKAPATATALDTSKRPPLLAAGDIAPDFAVDGVDGKPIKLSGFRGKTVILDFWATWCWPCNQSLPHTDAVVHANRDKNVVALAVAIWDSRSGFDTWVAKHHYGDIQFAVDPSPQGKDVATTLYHVSATPTAYIIGPDGKVVSVISGYSGPSDELQAAIDSVSPKSAKADR
jgi:peroxiredoxin/outer membrane lipoprotein-sorting protein